MNDLRVHSAYKKASLRQIPHYGFIVASSVLHDNASFTIQFPDQLLKRLKISGQVWDIKGFYNNLSTGAENYYSAFPLGDINTYCVHVYKNVTPYLRSQLVSASFTHCSSNLLWCDTNAANEELVSRLIYGHKVQGGSRSIALIILTA